jgi:class 3 adenylate cyclase/tetratricopeptide (TPR) repeat protein
VVRNVDEWLESLGLSRYSGLFAENEIDFEVLTELTEQDLKDLQIPLGHRKKLLKGIATLCDGASAADGRPKPAAASPLLRPEAERRQLTVMFCDLVDSTALSERFDPEDLREIIRAYQETCARVIARYGGYVAKFMGDGILVYFGYPQAHEDDGKRATRAGLEIVEAVADLGTSNPLVHSLRLSVRVGISTGPVVVGDIVGEGAAEEASVIGETPNVAARLQALAQPNQIVIGALTRQIIGNAFALEDLGERLLKGIARPVHAWRVMGTRDIERGLDVDSAEGGSPLVGRQEELGLLLRAWEASKSGHGQGILIQGEAGIGKSRLAAALRAKAKETGDRHAAMTIQCSSFHAGSTLYPVIEHLKRVLDWKEQDMPDELLSKLEGGLRAQNLPLAEVVPLLAELMGVPLPEGRYPQLQFGAQELRERTLDVLAGWLLGEAEKRAVLCIWEDVHWADPTTLELLALCIEQSPTVAMMNVLTFRSDFKAPWAARSHISPISLNRLERPEVEAMVRQQAGGKALPSEVVDYIVDKADGVPLYVEELSKAILEADFLREEQDRYELTGPLSGVTIPATLQDLLMARLDRLPTVREVAQIGSILGREFAYEMIQAISAHEELTLQNGLDQLVQAELLYQRGRRPHARYTFKHALVQDAAYHSLLKRTRKYYHQQVGELLERRYPEIAQSQPDLVAQHYVRAENDAKAVEYLTRFADKAAGLYAHAEAVTALEEALLHAERLASEQADRCVLEIALRLAESLHFLGRRQELVQRLLQQEERLNRLADASLAGKFYFWLGFAHSFLGHRTEAKRTLGRALEEAARCGDDAVSGRIHRALAMECTFSGQPLEKAVDHGRQAVALLERNADGFWLAQALFALSYASYYRGDFNSSLGAARRLEALGERTGSRRARANAVMMMGLSQATRGDWAEGIEAEQRALELSPDDFETAWILACLGKAQTEGGDAAQAIPVLEQAVELADRLRSLQFRCWFRTMLGDAYVLSGDLVSARRVVGKALEVSTEIQFLLGVGLAKQVLGRIGRAENHMAEAMRNFTEAVITLSAIGARFELARTHFDLATLAQTQGDAEVFRGQLLQAHQLFSDLQALKYVERASQLGEQAGLSLVG